MELTQWLPILQLWGGSFYLANKIFFSLVERTQGKAWKERFEIAAWGIYVFGLPPWVVILAHESNWIATFLEAAGLPAMIIGLVNALKRTRAEEPAWLRWLARVAIGFGLFVSIYDKGGFGHLTQYLEIGLALGFLLGTYHRARGRISGYWWLMLMHLSTGLLLLVQNYDWLAIAQFASLWFVIDAYIHARRATMHK